MFPTLCSSSKLLTEIEPTSVVKEKGNGKILFDLFLQIHSIISIISIHPSSHLPHVTVMVSISNSHKKKRENSPGVLYL